jgi:vacuolar fusion protein MON1
MEDIEIGEQLSEMYLIRKHYLIFTDAGKPIYSRYGDENNLAPFFATLSAVIPKIQNYFWANEDDVRTNSNRLHCITSGQFKIHFIKKGTLYYICLINQHKKCSMGTYFIDELATMPMGHR